MSFALGMFIGSVVAGFAAAFLIAYALQGTRMR